MTDYRITGWRLDQDYTPRAPLERRYTHQDDYARAMLSVYDAGIDAAYTDVADGTVTLSPCLDVSTADGQLRRLLWSQGYEHAERAAESLVSDFTVDHTP